MSRRIAIVGGGNMGFALAKGLSESTGEFSLRVADPATEQRQRLRSVGIRASSSNREAVTDAEIVIFAVKPAVFEDVAEPLVSALQGKLVLSVVAGARLSTMESWFGEDSAIVRCMPNTPALIGAGITGMVANAKVSSSQREVAESLLRATGSTVWFSHDDELDAVTALSGSGPAYFLYLIEALTVAGVNIGLSESAARQLVIQTALGTSRLVTESDEDPHQLRINVTSPGGTTESAVNELDNLSVAENIQSAVRCAYERSIELGKGY